MKRKTRVTMIAGFVALLVGSIGAAYLGSRPSAAPIAVGSVTQVYVTAGPVAAGTSGTAALGDGRIVSKSVSSANRPANAVSTVAEVSAGVAVQAIPAGVVLTTGMFAVPQTRIGTIVIPPGKRALALELQPLPGLAGFAGTGDRVDVFGISKGEGAAPPAVRLVLQGIDVLNVNGVGLPAAQGQPGSPNLIYLLAVTPAEAERLIYLNLFDKLYFDLVPKGEGPVKTPGVGPAGALAV